MTTNIRVLKTTSTAIGLILLASGNSAFAQAAPQGTKVTSDAASGNAIEEIIVTAQRRSENLQKVPIAITALSADRLAGVGISNAQDLGTVTPSLQTPSQAGYLLPRLRGIGTSVIGAGIENSVAVYVDGVYQASTAASIFAFTGIERIEVLKGPQGTLFGRNATGGLIQVVTREPQPGFSGEGSISYGNYNTVTGDGYLSGGSDTVRGSFSVRYQSQGKGYGTNFATGADTNRVNHDLSLRGKLVILPSPNTKITLSGDYADIYGSYPDFRVLPNAPVRADPSPPAGPFNTNSNTPAVKDLKSGGASLRVDQELGAFGLTAISAYRRSTFISTQDLDRTPLNIVYLDSTQQDKQFSQEIQLHSNSGSKINWLLGGYYFWSNSGFAPNIVGTNPPAVPAALIRTIVGTHKADSLSAFGQATLPLTDRLRLTVGGRYISEKRAIDVTQVVRLVSGPTLSTLNQVDDKRFSQFTWRLALDYQLTPSTLLYASFNRGFKSGGFNLAAPGTSPYLPEILTSYEAGLKTDLFDRKLRISPAFFYYDYKNIQVSYFPGASGGTIGITNACCATIYGADLDFELVVAEGLKLQGGASLIHDRFGDFPNAVINTPTTGGANIPGIFQAQGNRLPYTADFSGNIGIDYRRPLGSGEFSFNSTLYYNGGYFPETDNLRRVNNYAKLNLSLGWASPGKGFSVRLWAKNLTDHDIPNFVGSVASNSGLSYEPPRTYGVTIGTKF